MWHEIRNTLFASVLVIAVSSAADAAQQFDSKSFESAQAAGKAILIDVTATWCATCRNQRPIIEGAEKQHPKLVVFEVDFDTAKDVLKRFRVQYQSTLIVFKGSKEVGRSTGDTNAIQIWSIVEKGF